jgi:hypothetical protein
MIINSRADLDALQAANPAAYKSFMAYLQGGISVRVDTAVYPSGYGQPGYTGASVTSVWQQQDSLGMITKLGFASKDVFLAAYTISQS